MTTHLFRQLRSNFLGQPGSTSHLEPQVHLGVHAVHILPSRSAATAVRYLHLVQGYEATEFRFRIWHLRSERAIIIPDRGYVTRDAITNNNKAISELILFSIFQVDQYTLTKVGVWSFRLLPGYKFSRHMALLKLEALRLYDVSRFLTWLRKTLKHCLVTRFILTGPDITLRRK